jgi:hypothetical protein
MARVPQLRAVWTSLSFLGRYDTPATPILDRSIAAAAVAYLVRTDLGAGSSAHATAGAAASLGAPICAGGWLAADRRVLLPRVLCSIGLLPRPVAGSQVGAGACR